MSLPVDVLARIERLELEARGVVEGYLAGRHKSPRHGFAVEFSQHREYAPGDDLRHVDWKVFGRTERYHLKQYEQETNLVAWLIVDASESMRYGSGKRNKFDTAATLAVALAYLISNQTDSVGLATFATGPETILKPSGSSAQVKDILRVLGGGPLPKPGAAGKALHELAGRLGRRGIVFLLSDLLDDPADVLTGVKHLRYQKHEVIVLHVMDGAELDFPFRHPTEFRGLEQLGKLPTDPLSVRDGYLSALGEHLKAIEEGLRLQETDYLRIRTDDDLGQTLAGYLRRRMGK
ncbi:MAG TPA: DUF58 domain-containing protein [Fimbriiglobus sp.]|jgi:uncharacterized protein (DUF58 family)